MRKNRKSGQDDRIPKVAPSLALVKTGRAKVRVVWRDAGRVFSDIIGTMNANELAVSALPIPLVAAQWIALVLSKPDSYIREMAETGLRCLTSE